MRRVAIGLVGFITPVQMEGLRLLLTPFPQEEFNQTEDRKSADQSLGVTCLSGSHSSSQRPQGWRATLEVAQDPIAGWGLSSGSGRGVVSGKAVRAK